MNHSCKPGRYPQIVTGTPRAWVHIISPGQIWKCPDCRKEWVAVQRGGTEIVWRLRRWRDRLVKRSV